MSVLYVLVWDYGYDGIGIGGVYSSPEKAEAAARQHPDSSKYGGTIRVDLDEAATVRFIPDEEP